MNDISLYNQNKHLLRRGDVIFSWGSGLLSHAIELLSDNGPSHVQIYDSEDMIVESTIENGVSGVQRNKLSDSVLYYPAGSKIGAALLSEETRARADWSKFDPFVDSCVGKVAYDVAGLVKFLEPQGIREGQINDKKMVCSSFATALFEALNILYGIPYSQVSPQWFLEMRLFSSFVPLLGDPKPHNFNTL